MRSIAQAWARAALVSRALVLGTLFAVVFAALLASPQPLAAQGRGQSANDKEQSAEYRQLVKQALDEFQRGNWDEAAGLFAQAHKLSPSARTLRGMGLAAFEGRRYVDALGHLRAALDSTVNPLTADQRAEVTDTVSRAEHYVAKLEITVEPTSSEVRINGVIVPDQDGVRMIMVDPGMVEVRASSPGYELEVQQLRLVSGARQQLALRLGRQHSAQTNPLVGGGDAQPPRARRPAQPFGTLAWLGVGLAAASGIGTIVAWRVREDAAGVFNSAMCAPDRGETRAHHCPDEVDRVTSAETAAVITGVGAGVFLSAAVVFFVLDANNSDEEAPAAATACGGGPGDLGVSCSLRF